MRSIEKEAQPRSELIVSPNSGYGSARRSGLERHAGVQRRVWFGQSRSPSGRAGEARLLWTRVAGRGLLFLLLGLIAACSAARREPAPGIAASARAAEQGAQAAALAGDFTRALDLETQALGAWQKIDSTHDAAATLVRLARLQAEQGQASAAAETLAEAAELARGALHVDIEAAALVEQANLIAGDDALARTRLLRALALAQQAGAQATEAAALNDLALLERSAGDPAAARTHLERALEIDREGDRASAVALRLRNLARLDLDAGDVASARVRSEESLALSRGVEDVPAIAESLALFSETSASDGASATAILARWRALAIHRALGATAASDLDQERIGVWCQQDEADRSGTAWFCAEVGKLGPAR